MTGKDVFSRLRWDKVHSSRGDGSVTEYQLRRLRKGEYHDDVLLALIGGDSNWLWRNTHLRPILREWCILVNVGYDRWKEYLKLYHKTLDVHIKITEKKYGFTPYKNNNSHYYIGVGGKKQHTSSTFIRFMEIEFKTQIGFGCWCLPYLDVVRDDDALISTYNALKENFSQDFPVSMRERIAFLYSEELAENYEKLLKFWL